MQQWLKSAGEKLGKYKYALLIVLIGIGILLIPGNEKNKQTELLPSESTSAEAEKLSLQKDLADLLCRMQGVGKAAVLLCLDSSGDSIYWQDQQGQDQTQTVFLQNGNLKNPAIRRRDFPKYRGAVIVCEGADRANVQLCVKEAVSSLTGLGMDKITVIKMKGQ